MYGCETWALNAWIRRRLEVFEMNGLRVACRVRRVDRIRNITLREMCGWNKGLVVRAEQGILRWFGHVVRMDKERLVKKVFGSSIVGTRARGRPKWRWLDGVSDILGNRGLSLDEGMMVARDRDAWKGVVYGRGRE